MIARAGTRALLLALAAAALTAAPAWAVPAVSGEFPVSELNSNNKLVQGPDGNMWLTLGGANDVAKVTPDGVVTEYELGVEGASGITVGPEQRLWITQTGGITSFLPADPVGTKSSTAIATIAGNHSIVLAPDGNLWVATSEKLIRISPANTAERKEFAVAGLGPRDIDVAGSLLAIADFGETRVVVATLADPPVTTDFKLTGGSQGVAGAPSGLIALTQQANAPTQFGLLTPPGPPLLTDSPGTDPFGVALGPDGAFWIAQFAVDTVTRLGADNVATTLSPGFAAASGPRQVAAGPGNTLWVTLETAKKVGRISGVDPEVPPPPLPISTPTPAEPRTELKAGPKGAVKTRAKKAKARFRFRSPDAGATFQCRLRQLPKGKAAKAFKAPKFKGCRSPKTYRLGPGRYRFEVRAVLNGVGDGTPAKRSFRVIRVGKKK